MSRTATIKRETKETSIELALNLDGAGKADVHTGVGFLDHMLDHLAVHSLSDLAVKAEGDLQVDDHHTAEDVAICLGEALASQCRRDSIEPQRRRRNGADAERHAAAPAVVVGLDLARRGREGEVALAGTDFGEAVADPPMPDREAHCDQAGGRRQDRRHWTGKEPVGGDLSGRIAIPIAEGSA